MKTYQEFIQERVDLPGNTGAPTNPRLRGRDAMRTAKPSTSASAGKVTIRHGGKGPKPSFMNSINSNDIPSQVTTQRAPKLNVNPNIKYSGKTIDSKSIDKSNSSKMAGIIL